MSNLAILIRHGGAAPTAVKLEADSDELLLATSGGSESIAWWRLYRIEAGDTVHRFGRLDRPGWELRVAGGADQALLSHVKTRSLLRIPRQFHRLGLVKMVVATIVLAATFIESVPARWVSSLIPDAASERMVSGFIKANARLRCGHDGGAAAMRKILTRLDPELGPAVEIVGINQGGLMVTSLPPSKIMILRDSLTAIDGDAIAALLAHELSHIRHRDTGAALVRYEGNVGSMFAILEGEDRRTAFLEFSGEEEERADREAIASMKRAGIPLASAAKMFEQMRVAAYEHSGFASEQRDFHFGLDDRAQRWAAAAATDKPGLKPAVEGQDADALFNFCWVGPLQYSGRKGASEPVEDPPLDAGVGKLPTNPAAG